MGLTLSMLLPGIFHKYSKNSLGMLLWPNVSGILSMNTLLVSAPFPLVIKADAQCLSARPQTGYFSQHLIKVTHL